MSELTNHALVSIIAASSLLKKGQGALLGVSGSEAIVLACQLCFLAGCRRFGYAVVPRSSYLAFNLAAGLPVPALVLLHGLGHDALGACRSFP